MKKIYAGWLLAILSVISAHAAEDHLKIKGYILQKEGGTPLGFATITLDGTSSGTVSDEKGYFEIDLPGRGSTLFGPTSSDIGRPYNESRPTGKI